MTDLSISKQQAIQVLMQRGITSSRQISKMIDVSKSAVHRYIQEVEGHTPPKPVKPVVKGVIEQLMDKCKGMTFEEFWKISPPTSNITNQASELHDFQQEIINDLQQYHRLYTRAHQK